MLWGPAVWLRIGFLYLHGFLKIGENASTESKLYFLHSKITYWAFFVLVSVDLELTCHVNLRGGTCPSNTHLVRSVIFPGSTVPEEIFNSEMCRWWLDSTLAWRLPPPTTGRPGWNTWRGVITAPPTQTPTHTHLLTLAEGFGWGSLSTLGWTWTCSWQDTSLWSPLRLLQDRSACWRVIKGLRDVALASPQPSPRVHFLPKQMGQT